MSWAILGIALCPTWTIAPDDPSLRLEVITHTHAVEERPVIEPFIHFTGTLEQELVLHHALHKSFFQHVILQADFGSARKGVIDIFTIDPANTDPDKGTQVTCPEVLIKEETGGTVKTGILAFPIVHVHILTDTDLRRISQVMTKGYIQRKYRTIKIFITATATG